MCGLIGAASTEGMKNSNIRRRVLEEGLAVNALRGDHSTGFAAFEKDQEDKNYIIYKKAYQGSDFVNLPRVKNVINDIEKYSCFIGHNRAATLGNVIHQNAHPFQFGHIILAHNGHINNATQLLPVGAHCPIAVDSAALAMAMSLIGEKEALEKANGGFALTWFNTKDKTLNFARNDKRPLKFVYLKNENTMFWASERQMLVWLLSREDRYKSATIDGKFKNVKEGVWYKFKLDNLREYKTVNFLYRPGPRGTGRQVVVPITNRSGAGAANKTGTGGNAGNATPDSKTTTTTESTLSDTRSSIPIPNNYQWERDIEMARYEAGVIPDILKGIEVPEQEVVKRDKRYSKNSGRPNKRKCIATASKGLSRLGFKYEQLVLFSPTTFIKYKNQNKLGKAAGHLHNTSIMSDICNIHFDEYSKIKDKPVVLCRTVNFTLGEKKNRRILVLELHPLWEEFEQEWSKRREAAIARASARGTGNPNGYYRRSRPPVDSSEGTISLVYMGPSGRSVSQERYDELTKHGCGNCSASLPQTTNGSRTILWIENNPICEDCATDPKNSFNPSPTPSNILH